jgi:UPF0755 protein
MNRKRGILYSIGLLFLLGIFLLIGFGYYVTSPSSNEERSQLFIVHDGSTLKDVADQLKKHKIIKSSTLFLLWARVMDSGTKIKAGEYNLSSSMPPAKILQTLTKGSIVTHAVTFPEGFTAKQIADLLEERGLVNKAEFLALVRDKDVAKLYGVFAPGLEGYLYPDTYQFGRGLSAKSIVEAMVRRFHEIVQPFKEKMDEVGMTMDKVVTLASIVEKETGQAEERPLIASVFLNRLKKRMRLESDPTVIYGLKDFDGNLKRKDLSRKTPYNTYVIRGLPPGPIANPGIDSIKSILYPAKTDYIYFVSKNDGTHHFSKTFKEHNRAVIKYQKSRRYRLKKVS